MSKKGIPHRKWSKEEKLKIVRLHLDEHQPIRKIEKECGVSGILPIPIVGPDSKLLAKLFISPTVC